MSYPSGSGNPGSSFHNQVGYSSSSDIEAANATDYSDHETGYSSAASNSFDFVPGTYQPSHRFPSVPPAYAQRYGGHPSSQSPPTIPLQHQQLYGAGAIGDQAGAPLSGQQLKTSPGAEQVPTGGPGGAQQYQRIARFVGPPPVALACTECRSRHLKCDAGVPSCSRCIADKRECCYVKSRRGWKGTRRKNNKAEQEKKLRAQQSAQSGTDTEGPEAGGSSSAPPPPPPTATASLPPAPPKKAVTAPPPVPVGGFSPPPQGPTTNPLETIRAHHKNSTRFPSQQEHANPPPPTANLMQLYYAYFHSAHPFCLPPAYLIKMPAPQLTVLLPVMRYIASFFARSALTETFRRDAENALFGSNPAPPKNAFTVQALLLFAIGLHSDNDQEHATNVKDIAADVALEIGMNRKDFSDGTGGQGEGGRVLEESYRRTWWELYFLDGIIAGVHQRDHFRLWSCECTVPLPCEEADYTLGRIPEPHSLQEFDDRYFAPENTVFSSFAYRVEAMRILGQVLAVGQGGSNSPDDPRADAADASIVNWGLHLPDEKKELVNKERRVDEMLFQAHMVINAATIYLHRPKSHLAVSLLPDEACPPPASSWSTPTKPMALHTAKAITAANTISRLITLPMPLIKHTPFFTCMITLASIVHLSACSWLLSGDEGFLAKERIRLGVGALKTLEEVWSIAAFVLQQVKVVAREVFRMTPPDGATGGGMISEEEVLRFLEEERGLDPSGEGEVDYHGLPALEWDGS